MIGLSEIERLLAEDAADGDVIPKILERTLWYSDADFSCPWDI